MTIEEALKSLSGPYKIRGGSNEPTTTLYFDIRMVELFDALNMALDALRAQQEAEKNEPLTLEDLKEMDGQPVWAEEPDGYKHYSRWVLVDCAWKGKGLIYLHSCPGQILLESFLLNGGKIYRRPPVKAAPTFPDLVDEDGRELPGGDRS